MLKIAWTESYVLPLPPNHRFPMSKYEILPQQLLHEGTIKTENIFQPSPLDEQWILNTHEAGYWNNLSTLSLTPQEIRRTGFPLTNELVQREIVIANGTVQCALYALKFGIAMNIAGGTHHAFTNRGEGFCLLNDVGIASNYLLDNHLATKILVVDLDVHQGNGTAEIFQNEPQVFTFSMHGKENYPLHKEKSDLDIELPTYTKDEEYLKILFNTLPKLIEEQKPDFLFFVSGVDILETDKLGKLNVSIQGCYRRDEFVYQQAINHKLPIVVSMGGGYSPQIRDIVEAHCNTFRLAEKMFF